MKLLMLATALSVLLSEQLLAKPTPITHHTKRECDINALNAKWDEAYGKARGALGSYNLTEKVSLATGIGWTAGPCVGNIGPVAIAAHRAIPAQGFPGLCLQDGPLGVRLTAENSAFPAAINAAATFNRDLMNKRAVAMGAEFRGKGVNVALGPMMNMMRAPEAGRAWEGWGGDPFLASAGAEETVKGIQSQGVQACAKHWLNNDQEHYRDTYSSNVDDRTQHEIYAAPFYKSILAGVASVMCSYNRVNQKYSCSNPELLNGLLKTDLGFRGYVLSDWWATHETLDSAQGLDMTMPGNKAQGTTNDSYFGPELIAAVQKGIVPQSRVDDMATRILAGYYLLGQDNNNYPQANLFSWNLTDPRNQHVNVQGDHALLIREIDAASTILLKNTGSLPLQKPGSIAIIGSDAAVNPAGPNACGDRGCNVGTLAMGWGSGTSEFPYLVDPLSAITTCAANDGTAITSSLSDSDLLAAATTATGKDVAIVFINSDSGEDYITVEGNEGDRNDLYAWHGGDALVQAVAAVNRNTVVVVHSSGPVLMEAWINNPNVTGVLWAGLPGQESGNGLVDVLYGAVNPSGRLPYTIAKQRSDYPANVLYSSSDATPQIDYTEGLYIDYRWFDLKDISPRFEFGFGLSYTSFKYSALSVWSYASKGYPRLSTDPSLHQNIATITFNIGNKGDADGTEIPQLYLNFPQNSNSPLQVLRGFDSIFLHKGDCKTVKFDLTRYDLSVWDTGSQRWVIPDGAFGVTVGASSRDMRLHGSLQLF